MSLEKHFSWLLERQLISDELDHESEDLFTPSFLDKVATHFGACSSQASFVSNGILNNMKVMSVCQTEFPDFPKVSARAITMGSMNELNSFLGYFYDLYLQQEKEKQSQADNKGTVTLNKADMTLLQKELTHLESTNKLLRERVSELELQSPHMTERSREKLDFDAARTDIDHESFAKLNKMLRKIESENCVLEEKLKIALDENEGFKQQLQENEMKSRESNAELRKLQAELHRVTQMHQENMKYSDSLTQKLNESQSQCVQLREENKQQKSQFHGLQHDWEQRIRSHQEKEKHLEDMAAHYQKNRLRAESTSQVHIKTRAELQSHQTPLTAESESSLYVEIEKVKKKQEDGQLKASQIALQKKLLNLEASLQLSEQNIALEREKTTVFMSKTFQWISFVSLCGVIIVISLLE